MSIRTAIYDLLNDIDSDVYPVFAPQETSDPYVVYTMRSEPILTQDFCGPVDVNLTIDIYASTFDLCVALAEDIFTGMSNAFGVYGDKELMLSLWLSETDSYIADLDKVNITQEYNLKFK